MKVEVKATGERVANGAETTVYHSRTGRRVPRTGPARQVWLVVAVVMCLLLVGAAVWWYGARQQGQSINRSAYQVVYLTNGQAYFGKLQNTDGQYLVMQSPYTAQSVETPLKDGETPAPTTTLLRVRDQVYGPDDSIAIRAETVAFWQNLRDDSKITALLKSKQQ